MKKGRIELGELPYKVLEQFSLTQEMIEDLPMHVLDDLCDGRHSPVLPIEVADESGERIKSRSRLAFIRKEGGLVDVVFYPALETSPLNDYDEAQQKQLLSGKVIIADAQTADGHRSKVFVQVDPVTNQVMSVPTPVIGRNFQVLAEQMHLGTAEVKGLQHGDPLTLIVENELMTVGIDLNARTGIRICRGDEQRWREQGKRDWDKYTFGVYGCWMMDDDGNLALHPEVQQDIDERIAQEQEVLQPLEAQQARTLSADDKLLGIIDGKDLAYENGAKGWYKEDIHGREVQVDEIFAHPGESEGKYRMTAVIDGEVVSHEITQKQYDKFMAVDDYHRMKLFSKIFTEVDMKTCPEARAGIGTRIFAALAAGAVVTSEVAHGLMHHRHTPEIYGERFGTPPRPYFKPGVDSPMDVAARNFEAQMNAEASDMRMGR